MTTKHKTPKEAKKIGFNPNKSAEGIYCLLPGKEPIEYKEGAILSSIDAWHIDLSNAYLSNAKLEGVRLYYVNLSNAKLANANMTYADLFHVKLNNADLTGVNLKGADLYDVKLNNVKLDFADLSFAKLMYVKLCPISFEGLSVQKIHPQGVILQERNIGRKKCDLTYIPLEEIGQIGPLKGKLADLEKKVRRKYKKGSKFRTDCMDAIDLLRVKTGYGYYYT